MINFDEVIASIQTHITGKPLAICLALIDLFRENPDFRLTQAEVDAVLKEKESRLTTREIITMFNKALEKVPNLYRVRDSSIKPGGGMAPGSTKNPRTFTLACKQPS